MKVFLNKCAVVRCTPLCDDLLRLAKELHKLSPSHRNPEQYHEDKSQIIHELKRLAREVREGTAHRVQRTHSYSAHALYSSGPSTKQRSAGSSDPGILFDDQNK